ncbi:YbdD/YjiX family protein [Vulcaniibacterium gelatinicum]|uniref:YbdD/YjiX family protein n=1 Tax=Vulcaniibacterium gelatinicum TaxID=2598725 RepID=UPI001C702906|nr:YbdD/YjiX family protein [Vulcaniibacterium gelatinicum]
MWPSIRPAEAMRRFWRTAVRTARLAIGVPDYEAYLAHMRTHHPGRAPMDRAGFFAERLQARYGRGRARCC